MSDNRRGEPAKPCDEAGCSLFLWVLLIIVGLRYGPELLKRIDRIERHLGIEEVKK